MALHTEHPLGIRVITILVALNGVTALLGGAELLAVNQIVPGIVALLLGLLLCHRAYAIWRFRRGAYQITQVLIGFHGLLALASLLTATFAFESAIGVLVAVGALLYLAQPRVRELFR